MGSRRACGRAGGRRSGSPSWERAGGRMGVCPGRAGRGGSRESSPGGARGGAPGGSSPGTAGLGPGVGREPWSGAGTQRPGRGAPSGPGSQLRAEGGAEVVEPRGAGRSAREPARRTLAAPLSGALALLTVWVSLGERRVAPGRPGAVLLGPWRSALPVPRPPRDGPCPGLAGTIALRLQ